MSERSKNVLMVVLILAFVFMILALASRVDAQNKDQVQGPNPGPPTPAQLPEVVKLRLLAAYQKAVIAHVQTQGMQTAEQTAVAEFNNLAETERKAASLPEGTRFDVKIDAGQVLVISPPPSPKPEPTPEVKKP